MPVWLCNSILLLLGAHASLGAVFACWFLFRGISRLDPTAAHAPLGFRLIIAPGVVALWPVLLLRLRGVRPRPELADRGSRP